MQAQPLAGGFADPPRDAAFAFRGLMGAMARPGRTETVRGAKPPAPLSVAAGVALLTLCDADTPVFLAGACNGPELGDWIAFHTGAPLAGRSDCAFAVGRWDDLLPLDDYPVGTSEYPDRSATLIVERDEIAGIGTVLRGPGIRDTARLDLPDPTAFAANNALFPLGLDFIFTAGDRVAALPRSTRIG